MKEVMLKKYHFFWGLSLLQGMTVIGVSALVVSLLITWMI